MKKHKEITPEQLVAINRHINLGRTLKTDHPEIAVIYGYYPQGKIVEMLNIKSEYGVNDNTAIGGIHFAISGHNGGYKVESYDGLIPDEEEREIIGRGHRSEAGKISSLRLCEQGKGIYGRTAEQRSNDSSKNGHKLHKEKLGIFGRTAEQHGNDSSKGVISRGLTPWNDDERKDAYLLSTTPEYQRGSQVNNKSIAEELNIRHHDGKKIRNARAISLQLDKHRKSLEAKVD